MLEVVVHLMVNRCEFLGGQMAHQSFVASIGAHRVHDSAKDFPKSLFSLEVAKSL